MCVCAATASPKRRFARFAFTSTPAKWEDGRVGSARVVRNRVALSQEQHCASHAPVAIDLSPAPSLEVFHSRRRRGRRRALELPCFKDPAIVTSLAWLSGEERFTLNRVSHISSARLATRPPMQEMERTIMQTQPGRITRRQSPGFSGCQPMFSRKSA